MAKKIAEKPQWLKAENVVDVYSVVNCVSDYFSDNDNFYISYRKHNGFWFFNSAEEIKELATNENIDLSETVMFYYEAFQYEFNEDLKTWSVFNPSFETDVKAPAKKQLEGFDVVTYYANTNPVHSPLFCNSLATDIPVNQHCLLNTLEKAKEALENGLFKNSERGPFRIFAVYTIE